MSCEFVIALSKTFLGQTGSSSAQYFSQREFPKSDRVDLFLRLDTAKTYFETKMVICGLQNILLKLFWFELCILILMNWQRPMLQCTFNTWQHHVWCNEKGFCAWYNFFGKLCLGGMYMSKGGEDMSFLLWSFVLFTKPRLATVNKAGNRLLSHRTLI